MICEKIINLCLIKNVMCIDMVYITFIEETQDVWRMLNRILIISVAMFPIKRNL